MRGKGLLSIPAILLLFILPVVARADDGGKMKTYNLSINVLGSGRVVGKDIRCTGACTLTLPQGTEVTLSAFPSREWHFVEWGGDCKGRESCVVKIDGDKNVTAIFSYP